MAVSRTLPGFVIYLHFKDSAFLTVKRDATFYFRYKKGILFLMEDIRRILKLKCWVMNLLQFSQMNWIYWFNIPSKGPSVIADIPPLKFEVWGITRLLRNINAKKAYGPDDISLAGFWIASHAGVFRDFCRSHVCLNEFGSTKTKAKLFMRRTKLSDLS